MMAFLSRLPSSVSRWLGHRSTPVPTRPNYIVWLWAFVGTFLGLSLIQAVFAQAHYFVERGVPSIVASYVCFTLLTVVIITDIVCFFLRELVRFSFMER